MNTTRLNAEPDDHAEYLIELAHQIISETSLFEFIDLDRVKAKAKALHLYPDLTEEAIDRYLDIIGQLHAIAK